MKHILTYSFLIISFTLFGQKKSSFVLHGKTKGIGDGTILLLQNPLTNKFIDSAKVNNNQFTLKTKFIDFPFKTILWKDSSTAKSIWVENNQMFFDATETNFEDAKIIGSKTDSLASSLRIQYKQLKSYDEVVAAEFKLIKHKPNNILSAHNLSIMATVFGAEKTSELFMSFSKKNRESEYGKKISDFLDLKLSKTPVIGENYVDFSMENHKGELTRLSEINEKVVLLEFWASWCLPCRKENPELVKTYNKFKNNGFEILAVSLDYKKEKWIRAIEKDSLLWKHVSDLKGRNNLASLKYGINGIPDNFLIDKNGVIIARNLQSDKLDRILSELLLSKSYTIKKEKNGTIIRLSDSIIWKDENGKILTILEVEKMLKTKKYTPNLDTDKNEMILIKTD